MKRSEQSCRWFVGTAAAFMVPMVAMYSGVYEQLTIKWDSEWMYALTFFGAPIALGAAWRSLWALVFPVAAAAWSLPFLGANAGIETFLLMVSGVPIGILMVGFGHVLGVGVARTAWDRAVTVFPIAVFALAALPLAESARRATFPRVPATEQGRLGLYDTAYLEALCEERDPRPGEIAPVQRLVAATEAHPDWVVTLTYEGSDETTTERRTLRQYVRQLLRNAPSSCRLDLRAQLQAAAR